MDGRLGERAGVRTALRDRDVSSRSALEDELELLGAPLDLRRATVPVYVSPTATRRLPAGVMLGATGAWLALVFGLCYLALPALMATVGLNPTLLGAAPVSVIGFGGATLVTAVLAAAIRPAVRLNVRGARDPVLSATAGGLVTWAIVHNSVEVLRPFSAMSTADFVSFLGANVVEMFLIGTLLASFTRSRVLAFGMGSMFQLVVMGIFVFLTGLLLAL